MKNDILWEEKPAEQFWDAHFLGNGHLGMSVMGGAPLEKVYINEDTLWSGSESFYLNTGHYDKMMEARRLSLEGKVKEANHIINNDMEGRWFETYLPMANVYITTGQEDNRRNMTLKKVIEYQSNEISEYRRLLDLGEAVETVSWSRDGIDYSREYFVSYPKDTAFIYCSAKEKGKGRNGVLQFALGIDSQLKYVNGAKGNEAYLTGLAPDHAEPNYTPVTSKYIYSDPETSDALRFACCVRVIACDGNVSSDGARVYVNNANFALVAIKAKTNYAGYKKVRDRDENRILHDLRSELDQMCFTQMEYNLIKEEHIQDYRRLYTRVKLDLGREYTGNLPTSKRMEYCSNSVDDPSLAALMLQYARYLTIAGSREGSQAMNLQGIWNDNPVPPWSCNYTNNINVEMNYWPCEVLALPECHQPLMDLLCELSVSGQRTAKEYYHLNGWVAHHNTDLWRSTEPSCEDASWSWWPFGGAWMCQHIWTHYEYSGNRGFLEKMYPVLRGAVEFMVDFLVKNKEGYLITAPSISPENKFITNGEETRIELIDGISNCNSNHPYISAVTIGSTMDMSILRELFTNYVKTSEVLGVKNDRLAEKAAEAMKHFPPFRIGRYGQLQEWYEDYEECIPGMGHISQMYPVYPGALFTLEETPELMTAARRSLERRQLHSKTQEEWPGAWRIALMARFKNSLECGHIIKSMGDHFGAGMLTYKHQQIDAILGFAAGIAEMLLQSHQGYIEILPAITVDWAEGSFQGLRAKGGFEVSAAWKQGLLYYVEIRSTIGGLCRVKAEGLRKVIGNDRYEEAKEGQVEFMTDIDGCYRLEF